MGFFVNLISELVNSKIAQSDFHAAGMLNVLECVKLDTDEQRLERCKLYAEWKKYYEQSKEFTSKAKAKVQARKNAIAGMVVPELLMKEVIE